MRYERKRFSFLEKGVVGNSKFEQRRKRELLPLGGVLALLGGVAQSPILRGSSFVKHSRRAKEAEPRRRRSSTLRIPTVTSKRSGFGGSR